jgi:hypothetical protein
MGIACPMACPGLRSCAAPGICIAGPRARTGPRPEGGFMRRLISVCALSVLTSCASVDDDPVWGRAINACTIDVEPDVLKSAREAGRPVPRFTVRFEAGAPNTVRIKPLNGTIRIGGVELAAQDNMLVTWGKKPKATIGNQLVDLRVHCAQLPRGNMAMFLQDGTKEDPAPIYLYLHMNRTLLEIAVEAGGAPTS